MVGTAHPFSKAIVAAVQLKLIPRFTVPEVKPLPYNKNKKQSESRWLRKMFISPQIGFRWQSTASKEAGMDSGMWCRQSTQETTQDHILRKGSREGST